MGAEPNSPDNQPLPPEQLALEFDAWDGPADKPTQQSLFSMRSGIQDLLVRPDNTSTEAGSQQAESSTTASAQLPSRKEESAPPETALPDEKPPTRPPAKRRNRLRSRRDLNRVRRRQKNYLEQRRAQKRRMVFYGRIRLLFKLCFALLLSVLLWELLHTSFWTYQQPIFNLHNQRLLQAGQVSPLIKKWVGKPIYAIDTGKLAKEIKALSPVVETVAVRRRLFPTRLEIMVYEKQPWAEIYTDEKQTHPAALMTSDALVDLTGYQYSPRTYATQPLEKVLLQPHTRYSKAHLARIRELAWQARQIPDLHLISVDARNPGLISLNYQEVRVILGKANTHASERLARLIPLLPKIKELQEGIAAVDLRWEEQVTFHKKPNVTLSLKTGEESVE